MSNWLKKGDTVEVLSGRDKGKRGKVTQVFPEDKMIVVDGVNIRFKHLKARSKSEQGQRVQFAAPMKLSKLQIVCPHCSKRTRVGQSAQDSSKVRMCKKCKQTI